MTSMPLTHSAAHGNKRHGDWRCNTDEGVNGEFWDKAVKNDAEAMTKTMSGTRRPTIVRGGSAIREGDGRVGLAATTGNNCGLAGLEQQKMMWR